MANEATYAIGFDLGTTNIVVAYAPLASEEAPQRLLIPQLTGPGQVQALPSLPAVRYHYQQELDTSQTGLPWATDAVNSRLPAAVIGHWAQQLGGPSPDRLISSAKSWLSYRSRLGQDPKLPSSGDVEKCTPVEVTAGYIAYVRAAWDQQFPQHPFSQQKLVITVPASFDDVARTLTIEAIEQAGIKHFNLLEEPQAACYQWLAENDISELQQAKHLMVCDVGGGTSDFTLINIRHSASGQPKMQRIGVGEHLMLGGDNMDLTLAAKAQQKLAQQNAATVDSQKGAPSVNATQLASLVPQCQKAKEQLLSDPAPDEIKLQVAGRGSGLMASVQQTRLTQKEVQQQLLDGFFPLVAASAQPKTRNTALSSTGLPYPADAAITRHIAQFLQQQQGQLGPETDSTTEATDEHSSDSTADFVLPDTWLLNGGPFNSDAIQARLKQQVAQWGDEVHWLQNRDPDAAVAMGAAHYARLQSNNQLLIQSAAARHYFLKVKGESGDQGICVLPMQTPLHTLLAVPDRRFDLRCGQAVQFEIASSLESRPYEVGELIPWHEQLHILPPLSTVLPGTGTLPVTLHSELDELGVLQVQLQAAVASEANPQHWHLAFNLRSESGSATASVAHAKLPEALEAISQWYGTASKSVPKTPLKKMLEQLLGKRETWSGSDARALFDQLLSFAKRRRRSAQHERTWFNLAGYCIRPGMGFNGDVQRLAELWPLYQQGIQYQQADVFAQWWAFWRRAAAGLSSDQQQQVYQDIQAVLSAKVRKQGGKPKQAAAAEERMRLVGNLERLPVVEKQKIADQLLKQLGDKKLGTEIAWSLARCINRKPAYAGTEFVTPAPHAEGICQQLLQQAQPQSKSQPQPQQQNDVLYALVCGAQPAPEADLSVSDELRSRVAAVLSDKYQPYRVMLSGNSQDKQQLQQLWGDILPTGLSLLD